MTTIRALALVTLAAFVLVDSLFLAQSVPELLPVSFLLFCLACLLQRSIPAT